MNFKLIALDIDGTITGSDHAITERTKDVLYKVRETGATVTIATGRSFRSAVRATSELELNSPIVSFQGAHLADPRTGKVLWHRPLTDDLTKLALASLEDWCGDIMAFVGDDVYVGEMTEWSWSYGDRQDVEVHEIGRLETIADKLPTRLVVVGDDAPIKELEEALISRFKGEMHITRSLPYFCEILHPQAGKHRALDMLCHRLGFRREETLVFGNGHNDVHMLKWAGVGVAVEGAVQEAIHVADRISGSANEEGPARMLESLLDENLIG